jgi:hypothetical protein
MLQKSVFGYVGNALSLNPPASRNLFKLRCFGVGKAWFKSKAPFGPVHFVHLLCDALVHRTNASIPQPCQIPDF